MSGNARRSWQPLAPYPWLLLRGRRLSFKYKGKALEFEADPNGSDFQRQIDLHVAIADKEAAAARNLQNSQASLEAMPGGMPDILPLYEQALQRAKANGKVVLAISTASSCVPCHQLDKMFKDRGIKPIMEKHYEILWIDCGEQLAGKRFENKNGEKLCRQLGIWTGFPSYVAVGGDGKVLAVVGTNGYPMNESDDAKFFKVLNAGGKLLSEAETNTIQNYLNTHRYAESVNQIGDGRGVHLTLEPRKRREGSYSTLPGGSADNWQIVPIGSGPACQMGVCYLVASHQVFQ